MIDADRHGLRNEHSDSSQGGTSGADSNSGGAARAALTAREWFEHSRDLRAAPPNRGFVRLTHPAASPQTEVAIACLIRKRRKVSLHPARKVYSGRFLKAGRDLQAVRKQDYGETSCVPAGHGTSAGREAVGFDAELLQQ